MQTHGWAQFMTVRWDIRREGRAWGEADDFWARWELTPESACRDQARELVSRRPGGWEEGYEGEFPLKERSE